ncbi:4-diphosphocytidyl-2-C-methyl-D-erythritol kinase [Campylobacterota bacterium]|nr:4-diphosphocytidyl-2-C-methyl-D-erythritol kinase [Campylobacterota bacterium]
MASKIYDAPAKINVFLKVVGRREDGYHLLSSRFVRYDAIVDKLWFEKAGRAGFEVVGDFDCPQANNTIVRALSALAKFHPSKKLFNFAAEHKVVVYKQIPSGAGLGGASSDAAAFLQMINLEADLRLNLDELTAVGASVGADIPFFLSGCEAANVSGIGEIVETFDEKLPKFEVKTPPIACETIKVYQTFRHNFSEKMAPSLNDARGLTERTSRDILLNGDPLFLNDLLSAALKCYPELLEYMEYGYFFSGSGSSFFKITK